MGFFTPGNFPATTEYEQVISGEPKQKTIHSINKLPKKAGVPSSSPVFPSYVRRLTFTGGTTGYITLPKSWIRKQGIQKGDLLELSIQEEKIIIKKNENTNN
jgi:hypothetical protein